MPPIHFLHRIFSRPALLEPWIRHFEAVGFECHAPALPGRDPTDEDVLGRTGPSEYFDTVLEASDRIGEPPTSALKRSVAEDSALSTETSASSPDSAHLR